MRALKNADHDGLEVSEKIQNAPGQHILGVSFTNKTKIKNMKNL